MSLIDPDSTLEDFLTNEQRKRALLDTLKSESVERTHRRDWRDLLEILRCEERIPGDVTCETVRMISMNGSGEEAELLLNCLVANQGFEATVGLLMKCMQQAQIDCSCLGVSLPSFATAVQESLQQAEDTDSHGIKGGIKLMDETGILVPSRRLFIKLSETLGRDWQAFGMYLGLNHQDLSRIDGEYSTMEERTRQCLFEWCNQYTEPCVEHIRWALEKMKRNDCVMICQTFPHFAKMGFGIDPQKNRQREPKSVVVLEGPLPQQPADKHIHLHQEDVEEFILELANMLTNQNAWKKFGLYLGLGEQKLDEIDNDKHEIVEKGRQCLQDWLDEESDPLVEHLRWVAEEMSRNDVVMFICKKYPNVGDGVDPSQPVQ